MTNPAQPGDEKTVVTARTTGSSVGSAPSPSQTTLAPGTRLGEFELTGLVGEGGFGIVYLAWDHSLERRVALKEYMPTSLAQRSGGTQVSVKADHFAETFTIGMRSFVNEAKLLAQFDHPSLVKVYRFWEANGTAYMAMPFYEGITLRRHLRDAASPPDEAWLKKLLVPLMDALDTLHRGQCYHRDIAPDNIMLLKDGSPLLLDFGAARRVIGDMTQALTVILKPGYAPVEQYAEVPGMKQGAFTDVYALAAVLYNAILGKTPPASVGRMMNDTIDPVAKAAAGRYGEQFLRGIDQSLAVRPEERPQSMTEMRAALGIGASVPSGARPLSATGAAASSPSATPVTQNTDPASNTKGSPSKTTLIVSGIAAFAIAGAAWFVMSSRKDAAQPQTATAPSIQTLQPTVAPRPPFSAVGALEDIFQRRSREHGVSFTLDQAQVRINRDKLSFRLRSSKSGYLYVFMVGTDKQHFHLLFPNALDGDNRVEAGKELLLPRPGWAMVAGGPAGTNHFVAVVSESERDFSTTGLEKLDPFSQFPLARAARVWDAHKGGSSPFVGAPVCPTGASGCPDSYGAAIFTIDEIN